MSGDGSTDIAIPSVFMQKKDAELLRELLMGEEGVHVLLTWVRSDPDEGGEGGTERSQGDTGGKEEESLSQGSSERISREVENSSRGDVVADVDRGSRPEPACASDGGALLDGSSSNSDHCAPDRI